MDTPRLTYWLVGEEPEALVPRALLPDQVEEVPTNSLRRSPACTSMPPFASMVRVAKIAAQRSGPMVRSTFGEQGLLGLLQGQPVRQP